MPRYFLLTIFVFWIPVLILGYAMKGKLAPDMKKALWITFAIMVPVTIAMEYVYLWTGIWTFSEELDPLLGIWIGPAPIEEFSFWFGGVPFMLLTYLSFCRIFPPKGK